MRVKALTAILASAAVVGGTLVVTTPVGAWWDIGTEITTTIAQEETPDPPTTASSQNLVVTPQGGVYPTYPTSTISTSTLAPTTTAETTTTVLTTNPNTAPTTTAGATTSTSSSTSTSSTSTSSSTTSSSPTSTTSSTSSTVPEKKVWVCKFVGKPGVDEVLQTGQNPISVSTNAIPDPENDGVHVGDEFADAQGRSLVIAFDDGGPEPGVENCVPIPPTTTTTIAGQTTTTVIPTTTTTEPEKKVWVCKFVGTPGVDERPQTGDNPISVSINSIPDPENDGVHVGDEFADAQGRSVVIAFDDGGPEPDITNNPLCNVPPTTTTTTEAGTTTTTEAGTTTTTEVGTTTTTEAGTTTTISEKKVWVCKFVGTPGVDERLQTGQNPISVSVNAIPNPPGPNVQIGDSFADAQGRSLVIGFDDGGPEPSIEQCLPTPPTTTTTIAPTTTTTIPATTTTGPVITPFAIEVEPLCPDGTVPEIEITFGNRPDLDGQTGTLAFSTGGSIPLVFDANGTTTIPYPASAGTGPVTMTYTLGAESVTRSTTFPEACAPGTTTTTGVTTSSTTTSTTTIPGTTTTTLPPSTTTTSSTTSTSTSTTLPETFTFGAAGTVCIREVPNIEINFENRFPSLAGQTGTLTMTDINGNVVGTEEIVYQPGETVFVLYPGTAVNPDGSIADVPGWILNSDGFWVLDPSDEVLREGIFLTYTVNPTAGPVLITYPPESSACANPPGPFPPGVTPPLVPGQLPPTQ